MRVREKGECMGMLPRDDTVPSLAALLTYVIPQLYPRLFAPGRRKETRPEKRARERERERGRGREREREGGARARERAR